MRRGAALSVVLVALSIGSALAVAGVFASRRLAASERSNHRAILVEPLAERALVMAITSWDTLARRSQPVGSVASLPLLELPAGRTETWITRLTPGTYWLVAEAVASGWPPLRRRIGVLISSPAGTPVLVPERAWSELP
jgi:hypothetical protein